MEPTNSEPAMRRIFLVVSGHDLDVSHLAAGVAQVVGRFASVACWVAEAGTAIDAPALAVPAVGACESVSVVVASSRPRLVGALHARLVRLPATRVLDPVGDPARLLRHLEKSMPRLLLLDDAMLERLTPRTVAAIPARAPGLRMLLLCSVLRPGLVERARCHGFHGCVVLGEAPEVWALALRMVADGQEWYPPAASAPEALPAVLDAEPLTPREAEIVGRLREGLSNKEIASRLGIREDTVKKHLQNVFDKLGIHSRTLLALGRVPARES